MPLIFIVGIVLVVFVVGAVFYNMMSSGYRQTIDRLILANAGLETDKAALLERTQLLERQLSALSEELERREQVIVRLEAAQAACERKKVESQRSVEEVLLDSGTVTQSAVDKAVRYLQQTGANRHVYEVMVMLGLVSPQDVLAAKRVLGGDQS